MTPLPDLQPPDRQPGSQPEDTIVQPAPQLERYAELLWAQQAAPPAWNAQQPAVQETYRRMAQTLRATVLAEVMARPGGDRTGQEITRLRAELVQERAHLADQVERLEDYILHLECQLSAAAAPVLRAAAGLHPRDSDSGDDHPPHRAP